MAVVVVYDACVLYPAHLRDLLLRLGAADIFQAKWTERILDEAFGAIKAQRPELADRLVRTRRLMNQSIRDVLVCNYESLIDSLDLPDPDDRHVLAAAIRCHAQIIVTVNLKDFPAEQLAPYGIEAQHPDEFVHHVIDLAPAVVAQVVRRWVSGLRREPRTLASVLALLDRSGLRESTALLARALDGLPPHGDESGTHSRR